MTRSALNSTVAVFDSHDAAEIAVKKLAASGFAINNLSVVGKDITATKRSSAFCNTADRVMFRGRLGAFRGGLSALGAMRYGLRIPKDSVVQYETELKADNLLVMTHGGEADANRARAILSTENPLRLDTHAGVKSTDLLVGTGN